MRFVCFRVSLLNTKNQNTAPTTTEKRHVEHAQAAIRVRLDADAQDVHAGSNPHDGSNNQQVQLLHLENRHGLPLVCPRRPVVANERCSSTLAMLPSEQSSRRHTAKRPPHAHGRFLNTPRRRSAQKGRPLKAQCSRRHTAGSRWQAADGSEHTAHGTTTHNTRHHGQGGRHGHQSNHFARHDR